MSSIRALMVCGVLASLSFPLRAQPVLSGATLFGATAEGAFDGKAWWHTVSGQGYNLYFYSDLAGSRTFLNSGNADGSLNPGLKLILGENVIQFAGSTTPPTKFLGLNLYFDNDTATNRINAVTSTSPSGSLITFWLISGTARGL